MTGAASAGLDRAADLLNGGLRVDRDLMGSLRGTLGAIPGPTAPPSGEHRWAATRNHVAARGPGAAAVTVHTLGRRVAQADLGPGAEVIVR